MSYHNLTSFFAMGGVLLGSLLSATTSSAATMNWGDVTDPAGDVMFLNVQEDSGPTSPILFGAPSAVGNQLVYSPTGFQSESIGAGGLDADLVDSTVTTTIMAKANEVIDNIQFSEFGDYTLSGLVGVDAIATVGAAFFYTVLEVDGSPVILNTQTASMQFSSGAGPNGGEFSRPGDDGTATPWSGSVFIDLNSYLATENIAGAVTKVRLRFDNTLSTAAGDGSTAFIKKKEAGGVIITTNVPEPASALLVTLAAAAAFATSRKS